MRERDFYHWEAPDSGQFPKNDNGENFIFSTIAMSFLARHRGVKLVLGIVSANKIDEEAARRGALVGEESNTVMEVLREYEERFKQRGRSK